MNSSCTGQIKHHYIIDGNWEKAIEKGLAYVNDVIGVDHLVSIENAWRQDNSTILIIMYGGKVHPEYSGKTLCAQMKRSTKMWHEALSVDILPFVNQIS